MSEDPQAISPKPRFWLMYLYCFFIFMEWSIIVPSILHYLQDMGATEHQAGLYFAYMQTSFAIAQLSVSLVAGILLIWLGSFKVLLIISSFLMAVGNVLYALADSSGFNSIRMVLVGRVIAGIGAGGNAVGMTYMATTCLDKKQFIAITGRYRTSGVTATILGAAIAGLFTFVDFRIGGYRVYTGTLPGLFTALCFILWSIACLLLIQAKPKGGPVSKAYRFDFQIGGKFIVLGVGSCIGSTMIYIMPTIMVGYGWKPSVMSVWFLVGSAGSLVGSVVGQEKSIIKFNPQTRSFNAFPVTILSIVLILVSLCSIWCGVDFEGHEELEHVCFVVGTTLAMFAYSLVNNVASSVLVLSFSEAEKTGMTPFTQAVVAGGKIVSPVLAATGVSLARMVGTAQWDLILGFWMVVTLGVLMMCCCKKGLLKKDAA